MGGNSLEKRFEQGFEQQFSRGGRFLRVKRKGGKKTRGGFATDVKSGARIGMKRARGLRKR